MEKQYQKHITSVAIILTISSCFLYLLCTTWLKWGDLFVDSFREFWVPLRIIHGKVLYKDIFYEHGIFPPYFLALIFKLFGITTNTLVGLGIVITGLMTFILYKLSRLFLNQVVSVLVTTTFLFVFAFGNYMPFCIYNFILPYGFGATFFILFVSCAVYGFIQFIFLEEDRYLLLWATCMTFAFYSRVVLPYLVWGAFVFAGALFIFKKKEGVKIGWIIVLFIPLLVGFSGYLFFLFKLDAFDAFYASVIKHTLIIQNSKFGSFVTGTDKIIGNSFFIFRSFVFHLLMVLLLAAAAINVPSLFQNEDKFQLPVFLWFVLIFLVFVCTHKVIQPFFQYRSMPLILLTGAIISFIELLRANDYKKSISLFVLFSISLVLISRIFFNTVPGGYGFYLLVLGVLCYYIFFFEMIKTFCQRYSKKFSESFFSSVLIILFILPIISYWKVSTSFYAEKKIRMKTNMGTMVCNNNDHTKVFVEAVSYLRNNTNKDDTIVVVPEGVGINFFSKRINPLRYYNFVPLPLAFIGEDKILSNFMETDIDYIVIVNRQTVSYGLSSFGIDYGKKISAWIHDNYRQEIVFGVQPFTSSKAGIAILKRTTPF